jgi:hypothetical protein
MKKELSRRDLMGRAGLALGGLVTLGIACGDEDPQTCVDTSPQVSDFPYEKHLPAGFAFDEAATEAVKEAAYHAYYGGGGCGHGSYSALLSDLAARAGAPFDKLPLRFGAFGGGGVAAYGSICGAVLGSTLIINSIVADAASRSAMMTTLMRWYERTALPDYTPAAVDAEEANATKTLDWGSESGKPAVTKVVPGSHLCHASVSGWCAGQDPVVPAGGTSQPDKKARCARVTADAVGKTIEMLNAYLASGALGSRTFTALAAGSDVSSCTTCHGTGVTQHGGLDKLPVATGMSCPSCHGEKVADHQALTSCAGCH